MYLRTLLTLIVVFNIGCMVNMGTSASRVPQEDIYNDNISSLSDVSITCIKAHLKSGRPAKEFRILENEIQNAEDTLTEAQRICNKEKNRYINILPCDSTRVRLTPIAGVDGSDYINANFIDGDLSGTERAYIATQGPLMHTRCDFWRMVWENNSSIIVMLGKEKENDRIKVDRYWPEEGEHPMRFHNLQVQLIAKEYDPDLSIAVRRLILTYDPQEKDKLQESRTVTHYQYEGWPDHGVPPTAAPIRFLVRLIERERINAPPQHSPMVVHCSAGVGRTGTFVTIHMTLLRLYHELINNNTTNPLTNSTGALHQKSTNNVPPTARFNLYNTVLKLRRQRPGMVQQQEQYVFCYEAVAEEAEQLGLVPPSPDSPRSPRILSVSTSSLPSPSVSSPAPPAGPYLRTSTSSYLATPTSTPSSPPNFLQLSSSEYSPPPSLFLSSSNSSVPSPPPSPYLDYTPINNAGPLFSPSHEQQASVDCRK